MKQLRVTLGLSYLVVVLICMGMALGIRQRSLNAVWMSTLRTVRPEYDAFAIAVIVLAILTAVGLFARREWGRQLSISLNGVVLFISVGMPFYVFYLTRLPLGSLFRSEALVLAPLAAINVVALCLRSFRVAYAPDQASRVL